MLSWHGSRGWRGGGWGWCWFLSREVRGGVVSDALVDGAGDTEFGLGLTLMLGLALVFRKMRGGEHDRVDGVGVTELG